jgi:replicative DNA helicase
MKRLADAGGEATPLTLAKAGLPASYVSEVSSVAPTTANWQWYESKVLEASQRTMLHNLSQELAEQYQYAPVAELVSRIEEVLVHVTSQRGSREIVRVGEVIRDYIETLEERYRQKELPGLRTGLKNLDDTLNGLQKQKLYIVAGRPSWGKSAVSMNWAVDLSVRQGVPVGYVLLEESMTELLDRVYAHLGIMDSHALLKGDLQAHEFTHIHDVSSQLHEAPFYVYDGPHQSLQDVTSQMRRMVGVHGCRVLFLDYAQLVEVPGHRDLRGQMVEMSKAMKRLAKELDVPVVILAQLHREADESAPVLAHLSETSQLEKDANGVILIYPDDHPKNKDETTKLVVAKNKDGPKKAIRVYFKKPTLTFGELEAV